MKNATVVLVSGEPVMRLGMAYLLRVDAGFNVTGETADAEVALTICAEHQPDMVVIDLALPRSDGMVLVRDVHRILPKTALLVISSQCDVESVQRAFRAGASGFVSKFDDTHEVLAAISSLRQGDRYVSRRIADGLLGELSTGTMVSQREMDVSTLSDRELQIFRLLGSGFSGSALSREIGVSVKTVETYRQRIKEKLRIRTGAQLIQKASTWLAGETRINRPVRVRP